MAASVKLVVKGGDKFEKYLKDLEKRLTLGKSVSIGFMEDAKYPNGTQVALVAAIQEFGAPKVGIPPHPYFRNMIQKNAKDWPKIMAAIMKQVDDRTDDALALLGEEIKGELQDSIINMNSPALSPVTLMIRKMKMDNPDLIVTKTIVEEARAKVAAGQSSAGAKTSVLQDTNHMLNSVTYKVDK